MKFVGRLETQGPGQFDLPGHGLLPEDLGKSLGAAELALRQFEIDGQRQTLFLLFLR